MSGDENKQNSVPMDGGELGLSGKGIPSHYQAGEGQDLWGTIRPLVGGRALIDHHRINVIEYVIRWESKGGVEDLRKARNNLDRMIEEATREQDGS